MLNYADLEKANELFKALKSIKDDLNANQFDVEYVTARSKNGHWYKYKIPFDD